ncbi:glycosyltransferase [Halalkalibacter krulwichiae]|uniref:Glycosyl transferase family 8 n=1 Tax=Halalkalibacter krulwichiae TaxID=199441 RepID=A0A1X9MDW6_9BACI|nr:glycosyltransferase [Halalkalibacter krulwichiae]ARK29741.1 Glycosyl transferase family 8 [Halalkalibacter krulwichiae]
MLEQFLPFTRKTKVVGNIENNKNHYHFCVTASKDYVLRVLALYESLYENSNSFKLWVCCMDIHTFKLLKKLNMKQMVLFFVEQIENTRLKQLREQRKMNEYCWTIKAPLIQHLLTTYNLDSILYCDGDLFFFSDPKEIFDEWGSASVYLTPQRDLDWVEKKYGKYQAGLIGFRNDRNGLQSVKWWRKRCEEWCSAEADESRFGDQKYLDQIPNLFSNVKVSSHLGINAAPWNCVYNNDFKIEKSNGEVYVENDRLIVYHFACFSILNENEYELWSLNHLKIKRAIKKNIYEAYIVKIRNLIKKLKYSGVSIQRFYSNKDKAKVKTFYKYTALRRKMDETDDFYCFTTIISKEYLIKGLALYQSLLKHGDAFHLWICCMDDATIKTLKKLDLKHVTLIPSSQIETTRLKEVKNDRTLTETCWTMKPLVCSYVLDQYNEIDHLVYCDADMYFFSSAKTLFDQWSTSSIFLSKQRSTPEIERIHGIYQAGLIGFKQEPNSRKILNWWKEQCFDWCYDSEFDPLRWGDQKYLNQIPHLFSNIKTIGHLGIDTAPWNLVMKGVHQVSKRSTTLFIDESPLICYHFGSMLMINSNKFELWKLEELSFSDDVLAYIYTPYVHHLQQIYKELRNKQIIVESRPFLSSLPANYTPKNILTI